MEPGLAPECPHGINIGMRRTRDLTDDQWKTLDPIIPKPGKRPDGRGRPWKSRRFVLNGVLWVLRTGAPWADLPDRCPSFQTCHRRFQQWVRSGMMTRIMTALAHELSVRGAIDVREAFIDASFAPAKKGEAKSGKRNVARERRSWRWQTVMGGPVSVCAESATPHEVTLTVSTLLRMVVPDAPQNLVGDNAYDSDHLDAQLKFYGIEVIAPHRRNRRNSTQDGRRMKRCRRRWKIERLFAYDRNDNHAERSPEEWQPRSRFAGVGLRSTRFRW
jgi:transposase